METTPNLINDVLKLAAARTLNLSYPEIRPEHISQIEKMDFKFLGLLSLWTDAEKK
jgi:hypothetical protein